MITGAMVVSFTVGILLGIFIGLFIGMWAVVQANKLKDEYDD